MVKAGLMALAALLAAVALASSACGERREYPKPKSTQALEGTRKYEEQIFQYQGRDLHCLVADDSWTPSKWAISCDFVRYHAEAK